MDAEQLTNWLVDRGITIEVSRNESGERIYRPKDGFYKSDGIAHFKNVDDGVVLYCRYDEKTPMIDVQEIVKASRRWHARSRSRFDGWESPAPHWAALYDEVST